MVSHVFDPDTKEVEEGGPLRWSTALSSQRVQANQCRDFYFKKKREKERERSC